MSTPIFSPSLICGNLLHMYDSVEATVAAGAEVIHMDIMDNVLVSGFGFSISHIKAARGVCKTLFDVHLMVGKSLVLVKELSQIENIRILLHMESEDFSQSFDFLRANGCRIGVAVFPQTNLEEVLRVANDIETVLLFTVNPGHRGQEILPTALERVKQAKTLLTQHGARCQIQVDGGVYSGKIRSLYSCGAEVMVVGSAFYGKTAPFLPESGVLLKLEQEIR